MKNPSGPKITLRDLALELGVSHATVSRALRDDARITPAVRQKVQRLADKRGYRRDPKLAELMTHLRRWKDRAHQGSLAWVTDHDPIDGQSQRVLDFYLEHAMGRAAALGYHLDVFTGVQAQQAKRLATTFRARTITGLVMHIMGGFNSADWAWDWSHFAVVHIGSVESELKVDTVDADDVGNNLHLLAQLSARGYRRIGVATSLAVEQALAFSLSGARRRFALLEPVHPAFPEFFYDESDPEAIVGLMRWVAEHQVDCVVSQVAVEALLQAGGLRVPEDIGVAFQGVGPTSQLSGIFQRDDAIAATALETVANSAEQGRFGIPAIPRQILLKGVWRPGTTTRWSQPCDGAG